MLLSSSYEISDNYIPFLLSSYEPLEYKIKKFSIIDEIITWCCGANRLKCNLKPLKTGTFSVSINDKYVNIANLKTISGKFNTYKHSIILDPNSVYVAKHNSNSSFIWIIDGINYHFPEQIIKTYSSSKILELITYKLYYDQDIQISIYKT